MDLNNLLNDVDYTKINKITISSLSNKELDIIKVSIRKIILKDEVKFQIESFSQKQVFHKNILENELKENIISIFKDYKNIVIFTDEFEYSAKLSKKGKLLTNKKRITQKVKVDTSHNVKKQYIFQEGMVIEPLIDLKVMNKDGMIIKSNYNKFKQINRFIEMIDDVIKKDDRKEINIIDFGCGKSYLTFILYYYLTEIKNIKTTITGLDLKEDVIRDCNNIAKKYNYENLKFEIGNINSFKTDKEVDMVMTLHACDTATDYALKSAIEWNAKYIFSVPCCQKEINKQLTKNDTDILFNFGLVKERFSSLLTDSIRGEILKEYGYETNLLEFIDVTHTPKNILIRGVKTKSKTPNLSKVKDTLDKYGITQTLHELLK